MMNPTFQSGMTITAKMFRDIWAQLRRQRIVFSERFTVNEGMGGTVVDLANVGGGGYSLVRTAVVSSSVGASSSQSAPGTYGSGTVKLDIDGGAGYTADTTDTTVKNRFPTPWGVGDLLVVGSNDNGKTWFVINRYCPATP